MAGVGPCIGGDAYEIAGEALDQVRAAFGGQHLSPTRPGHAAFDLRGAVVESLARAGVARIERLDDITEVLDPIQVLPAPGQGALAVECRTDDTELITLLGGLDDAATRAAVTAERQVLSTLEGGCAAPIGALGEVVEGEDAGDPGELWLRAVVLSDDGAVAIRRSASGPVGDAVGLGERLAQEMLADGADQLRAGQ